MIDPNDRRMMRYRLIRDHLDGGIFLRFSEEEPANQIPGDLVVMQRCGSRDVDGALQVIAAHALPDLVSLITDLLND